MHDAFVPLAEYLRGPGAALVAPIEDEGEPVADARPQRDEMPVEEALADVRRFRAALADALDLRVERLLGDIAASVLARELRIAPADLQAIVARELALAGEPPVRIRVHPSDREAMNVWEEAVVADPELLPGDVAIDLRSGTISATLGSRLERVLAAASLA